MGDGINDGEDPESTRIFGYRDRRDTTGGTRTGYGDLQKWTIDLFRSKGRMPHAPIWRMHMGGFAIRNVVFGSKREDAGVAISRLPFICARRWLGRVPKSEIEMGETYSG